MKIGLIADIHGNLPALETVLAKMKGKVDRIFCLGDLTGYFPFTNEVVEAVKNTVDLCIAGNHDLALIRGVPARDHWVCRESLRFALSRVKGKSLDYLKSLDTSKSFRAGGSTLLLAHGSPWNTDEYVYAKNIQEKRFLELDAGAVLLGHTHVPMIYRLNGMLLVNPGSCGQPRDGVSGASYAVLDTGTMDAGVFRTGYDQAALLESCRESGFTKEYVGKICRFICGWERIF